MRWRIIGVLGFLVMAVGLAVRSGADDLTLQDASHRARSVLLELRDGPLTLAQLNRRIPPSDLEWTQGIVWDVESLGWIEPSGAPDRYALTERGRNMLNTRKDAPVGR